MEVVHNVCMQFIWGISTVHYYTVYPVIKIGRGYCHRSGVNKSVTNDYWHRLKKTKKKV